PTHNQPPHSFPTRRSSDLPYQPHARACAGTDGSIWGRLANSSSSPAYFWRSESRELGIPDWALWLVSSAQRDRAHSQRIAQRGIDRKSTRLNSSHGSISYA